MIADVNLTTCNNSEFDISATSNLRASSYDEPWMTQTYYSIGSTMARPKGMSQC